MGTLKKKQSKIQMGEDIVMYILFFSAVTYTQYTIHESGAREKGKMKLWEKAEIFIRRLEGKHNSSI